jgi:hypothetical protein
LAGKYSKNNRLDGWYESCFLSIIEGRLPRRDLRPLPHNNLLTIGENKMNSLKILGSMALLLVSASAMAAIADVTSVPEPATLGLLGLGLAAIAAARRKR